MTELGKYLDSFELTEQEAEQLLELFNSPAWGLLSKYIIEPILDMSITQIDPTSKLPVSYQAGMFKGWHEVASAFDHSGAYTRGLLENLREGN